MLQEDDGLDLDDDDDETPQSPVLEKHERRIRNEGMVDIDRLRNTPPVNRRLPRDGRRRNSYRDVAYNAVRQRRIVPETLPFDKEESETASTAQTRPVRRLSIRSFRLPKDVAMRKSRSVAGLDPKKLRDDTSDAKKIDDRVLRRRHSPSFWNGESGKESFPRAGVSTSIQSPTVRALKIGSRGTPQERKENRTRGGTPQSASSKGVSRSAPISRLVQLRKQRLEKRGRPIR